MKKLIFAALIIFSLLLASHAENYVVANSKDGRDVLSAIFYANVKGIPVKFLPINGNIDLLASKVGGDKDVLLVESEPMPVNGFIESALKTAGNQVTVLKSSNGGKFNLELARKSGARKFIIVDSAYAHNAVSAMTYAARTKSYIILADGANAEEIKGIIGGADSVMVFGYVDKKVKDALLGMSVEYFGKGEDRFEDNVAMVDRTIKEFGDAQVWAVTGNFIEEGMASGQYPILYTAKLTPQVTYDYIKQSTLDGKIKVYVVIGAELVQPFHDTRDKIKNELAKDAVNKTFGILVKFAQSVPKYAEGTFGLDVFPVPVYTPTISTTGISYNKATGKLELTVKNLGEGPAYFTSEIRVKVNGEDKIFIKDPAAVLVERGGSKGIEYDFTFPQVDEGTVSADVLTRFGSSAKSSEQFTTFSGVISQITFTDKSDIEIKGAKYDGTNKNLLLTFRNPTDSEVYAKAEVELLLEGEQTKITSDNVFKIGSKSLYVSQMPIELTDKEIQENNNITIKAFYGARDGFLKNEKSFSKLLEYEKADNIPMFLIVGGVIALVAILFVASKFLGKKK